MAPRGRREGASQAERGIHTETQANGDIRIWWNAWAATIRARDCKVLFNHLHNLTYFACKGHLEPRCRCGEHVPEGLRAHAALHQFKVGEEDDG